MCEHVQRGCFSHFVHLFLIFSRSFMYSFINLFVCSPFCKFLFVSLYYHVSRCIRGGFLFMVVWVILPVKLSAGRFLSKCFSGLRAILEESVYIHSIDFFSCLQFTFFNFRNIVLFTPQLPCLQCLILYLSPRSMACFVL